LTGHASTKGPVLMIQKPPTGSTESAHRALSMTLPFGDTADVDDAARGFLGSWEPGVVRAADGRVVWESDSYAFLTGEAPATVNPSLWRQSTLVAKQGLFEVVEGIYQVRGLDLSNMTIVEGDTGLIVIDPLISTETAAAALALYREHRGDRPVVAVIYTHSHVDHFGGVFGVATQDDVDAGKVQVIAPEGFTQHAVEENVYAGTAVARRAGYMYGAALARGPQGQVGAGLGQLTLHNGVLVHRERPADNTADMTLTLTVSRMLGLLGGDTSSPGADIAGEVLESLLDVLERGNPSFNIMTP
jgi:alkyl sulfatase BDS1-like metallo-beta-lactamase superfamily hydrolase